ncbi:MAG TPA: hypothetical protein VI583_12595 [Cyclobacteriaceae bacterium]|nr:hypothetical protein [Cyclobacteriaceae bacterium]
MKYFTGEKFQCLAGAGIGIVTLVLAIYFLLVIKKPFFNGIAYPFLVTGTFLLGICIAIVIRSPADIARVDNMIRNNKSEIQISEIPRMETVLKNFKRIEIAEIIFIISGAALFFLMSAKPVVAGIGTGLSIQGLILFTFDLIAENRGKLYLGFLQNLMTQ